jgi:hypothetical protein
MGMHLPSQQTESKIPSSLNPFENVVISSLLVLSSLGKSPRHADAFYQEMVCYCVGETVELDFLFVHSTVHQRFSIKQPKNVSYILTFETAVPAPIQPGLAGSSQQMVAIPLEVKNYVVDWYHTQSGTK